MSQGVTGDDETVQNDLTPVVTRPKPPCRYYRHGYCKYGRRGEGCPFPHPKICMKFVKHGFDSKTGCSKGRKCMYLHPVMYKFSLHKKVCINPDCMYPHIKGTRRTQAAQAAPWQGNRNDPDPQARKEENDSGSCLPTRGTTPAGEEERKETAGKNQTPLGNLAFLGNRVEMLTSQQEHLQQMLARLMDHMGRSEPWGKRCCSPH